VSLWLTGILNGRHLHRRFGPIGVVLGTVAVAFASTGAAQPKIYDTGYEIIHSTLSPSLYWVDNNRLLFAGLRTADMDAAVAKKEDNRVERLKKLYVWDESTKSVKLYADARGVCVANGIVRYTVGVDKAAGKALVREGPFGAEKEMKFPLPSKEELSTQGQMARVRSNFTCKTHLRSEFTPPPSSDRNAVVLHDGRSYLDLGPSIGAGMQLRRAFPRNLVLHQANGKEIQLPMTWEEDFSPFQVAYSDHKGAYILRPRAPRGAAIGLSQPWPKNQPLVSYLVWADGHTESISIPYWPAEYLIDPRPVKTGWIFGGGKSRETTGLHLFDSKAVAKIDSGFVKEIAVAADGCKAAIAIQLKFREMDTPTNLRIVDLCS
jgi:hypothetical protein